MGFKVSDLEKLLAGRHLDGDGLYFVVREPNKKGKIARSWFLRTVVHGKRTDIGLGEYDKDPQKGVTLADARDKAAAMRKVAREGGNPLDERRKGGLTFLEVCQAYYDKEKVKFRSARHSKQWMDSLKQKAIEEFHGRMFDTLSVQDFKRMLLPLWTSKPHAAKRLKQRLQVIFD